MRSDEHEKMPFTFEGRDLGPAESFAWPTSNVAEGLDKRDVVAFGLAVAGIFYPVRLPGLEAQGIHARAHKEDPRIMQFVAEPGLDLDVQLEQPDGADVYLRESSEPGVVYVDARRSGRFALLLQGVPDSGAVCTPEQARFVARPFFRELETEPLAVLTAPAIELTSDTHPPEVVGRIRRHVDSGDAWRIAVAFGQAIRLTRGGGEDGRAAHVAEWARSLSEAQASTIEQLGVAEVDRLLATSADLFEDDRDDLWSSELTALCTYRDDLEAVRLVLRLIGRLETLEAALAELDEFAASLIDDFLAVPDPHLQIAASKQPDAWWLVPWRPSATP